MIDGVDGGGQTREGQIGRVSERQAAEKRNQHDTEVGPSSPPPDLFFIHNISEFIFHKEQNMKVQSYAEQAECSLPSVSALNPSINLPNIFNRL